MENKNTLNNKTKCTICPRECNLSEGQKGFCKIRQNIDGKIVLTSYGYTTGLAIDPVEKKPLYHFYPESKVLSFGTTGCCMGCQFCQNWTTTKQEIDTKFLKSATPKQIVQTALKYNCKSVAFTYNDPIIFYEYAIDTAKLCSENGIKTIAVTSGFINPEPGKEFFKYMDAANIDLKGFSKEFYKKNCLANLDCVLNTINYVTNVTNCHVELTTMLIDGENSSDEMIKAECQWILDNLGANIPIHFSKFHPAYKFSDRKPTSIPTILNAYNIAVGMGLKYVYTGNIVHVETSSTYCPKCKKLLIKRDGFKILENNLQGNICPDCGEKISGEFC